MPSVDRFARPARLVLAVAAAGFVLWSAADGPVVTPDGVSYLRMSLGQAPLEHPPGHFPGGYPFVLSVAHRLGLSSLEGARWIGALLVGVNVLLAGEIARRLSGATASLVVSAGMAAATPLILLHTMVLSEPLFMALLLTWLLVLVRGLRSRTDAVVLGALAAGAFLTRFGGVALVAATATLVWRDRRHRRTVALALALPIAIWALLDRSGDSPAARSLAWHPPTRATLETGARSLAAWVTGSPGSKHVGAVVALVALAVLWRARSTQHGRPLVITAAAYVGALVLTLTLLDAQTPLDERLLVPVQVLVILATCTLGGRARWLVVAMAVIVLPLTARTTIRDVPGADTELLAAAQGPTAQAAAELTGPLWSNGPSILWLASGAEATLLPMVEDPHTLQANADLDEELAALRNDLGSTGRIVWFDHFAARGYLPTRAELIDALDLVPVTVQSDGVVYRVG